MYKRFNSAREYTVVECLQVLWLTILEQKVAVLERWSDQTHQLMLETWNSRTVQNVHESAQLAWEQFMDLCLQIKCSYQDYDINVFIDSLQSKIFYLTGNSCK